MQCVAKYSSALSIYLVAEIYYTNELALPYHFSSDLELYEQAVVQYVLGLNHSVSMCMSVIVMVGCCLTFCGS